jgi:hypothetical protein
LSRSYRLPEDNTNLSLIVASAGSSDCYQGGFVSRSFARVSILLAAFSLFAHSAGAQGGPAPSSATFLRSDATTLGNWHAAYGADGYAVAGNGQTLPGYASFAVQNQEDFTWTNNTTDTRALQTADGSNRIAAVWYNTSGFSFDVNFADGNAHQFALYALDWDATGRAETVQIVDATSQTVLDTESISSFTNGVYLVWNIAGHVQVNISQTAGNNAVVNGVFFGGSSIVSSVASFVRTDSSTQGNWHGTYGADGYSIANDSQSIPSYASFAVQNQQNFTWSDPPADVRALETGNGSDRIASVWYNTPEFNFDLNLTDGNSHQFALYAVDWDNSGRAETIQILDAATDALLDTRSISNFTNGLFLVWNVKGHIKLNVIQTAGNNAVVSGVFFGANSTISSSAAFLRTDTTTQGNWHGTYGSEGYSVANDSQSVPTYASFAVQNQQDFTWSTSPTDMRSLQTGSASGRIAAVWYSTSEFNFDVNFTDGNSHQFAFYAVDWDNSGRAETIQILDAATDALLDTRSISNFSNGLYLVWNVAGHVKVNIIQTAGNNAVVSGVFFGGGSTINSTASFVRTDTTTQGSWHGTYGSDGYSIANDSQSLPSYANFAVQNQSNWTWLPLTTDPRALQTGSNSGSIAATWYNAPEFNLDVNLTDGQSHQLALYAMDWDSSGRAETIELLDAATGALLDTRNISSFVNGLYLVWNVSGHVKFNIILTAGNNAIISGVFFAPSVAPGPPPSITSLYPPSAPIGALVTVIGSGFGATQQTSSVKFNGIPAMPSSWSDGNIVVSVPVGATTGNVNVQVGGAASNPVVFTVVAAAYPPGISATAFPSPNGSNWNNTNVTISYSCSAGGNVYNGGVPLMQNSCAPPRTVTTEGANQQATGSVTDAGGNSSSVTTTLNIDKTPPALTITSPADQSSNASAAATITGTVSDSLSGLASMSCNGTVVPVTSGGFSCNISLNPGVNLVMVQATDIAGNSAGARLHLTYSIALPAPASLQITPASANVLVGNTQQFTATDQLGRPRTDASWTVDNTNIATISTDSSPILTGLAAGTVTLTAFIGSISTQVQVNILSGLSLPIGTTVWSAPSVPGFTTQQIVQAVPTPGNTPGLFAIDQDSNENVLVRAFTGDGQQLWQTLLPYQPNPPFNFGYMKYAPAMGDSLGGLLIVVTDQGVIDLDGQSGAVAWVNTNVSYPFTSASVGQDGSIITTDSNGNLVKTNPQSGQPVPTYSAPLSVGSYESGICVDNAPVVTGSGINAMVNTPSSSVVDAQGNAFFTISYFNASGTLGCVEGDSTGGPSTFTQYYDLVELAPDGTATQTNLPISGPVLNYPYLPVVLAPDGKGGALVQWATTSSGAVIMDTSTGATYPSPLPNGFITQIVFGDNGIAMATDGQNAAAFPLSSFQSTWNYQAPAASTLTLQTAVVGQSLIAKTTDQNNLDTIVGLDPNGNPTYTPINGGGVSYAWNGSWNALVGNVVSSIALPQVPVVWATGWAEPNGSSSANGEAVVHHSFGLFWCGAGLNSQGYFGPCQQGNGNDVVWGYYPVSSGEGALQDFSHDHPDWVGIIQSAAMKAFQAAYLKYGVQVQIASQTPYCPLIIACSKEMEPQQEYTAFVLGDYPYSTAGQRFLASPYSGVYYFYFLENAQIALGQEQPPGQSPNWLDFSPTYPPQDVTRFVNLLKAIGTAIGNGAAHEMGHQLELITTLKSNNNKGFPFMDCGLGLSHNPNRDVPIACENNDNFVYGFFTAEGYPQDPTNPYSLGGMFFYGVPGGQNGVPPQSAIHWGPSDICWLKNYINPGSCVPAQ